MSKYIIQGGNALEGSIPVKGAKNSVLPLLAASILTQEPILLQNCPHIADVENMMRILRELGCRTHWQGDSIFVDASDVTNGEIPSALAGELRSSIFLLGALLSRLKWAKVAYPGGCDIGMRPIDIHLRGLRELGVQIKEEAGYLLCEVASDARTADIVLDLPSVGATENLMMASVFCKGKTVLRNCAKEPESVDLQDFLNAMGASVRGAGGSVIVIEGVDELHGTVHTPIPDRIVAGTYLIGAAMCGGNLTLERVRAEHIASLLAKLSKTACKITTGNGKINLISKGRLNSLDWIETTFYPGFPTDLQTQVLTMQTIARGTCVIVENIFETRFRPVGELRKMGADITVRDKVAVVRGVESLHAANVTAADLRGGASLVLAAMAAHGKSEVREIRHIDRGYEDMSVLLRTVGVDIQRKDE